MNKLQDVLVYKKEIILFVVGFIVGAVIF